MSMLVAQTDDDATDMVFELISQKKSEISEAALAQALLQTALYDESQARAVAAEKGRDGKPIDKAVFADTLQQAVRYARTKSESSSSDDKAPVTVGAALIGVTDDLKHFYSAQQQADQNNYRLANLANMASQGLKMREEAQRKSAIAMRQEAEHQGVQEAQMMQAMEFNSAWSQNMTEFERQAREIEEGAIRRHQEEFDAFQQTMYNKEPKSYKFSRELLNLKKAVEANAKQGRYDEAHKIKRQADQLERLERLKLDNEHKTIIAQKELQLRQQQQTQLEALRRRIQRGREEHKEHWLMGAQRLMQSHRNMLSDLRSRQALENLRSTVAVKLDMQSHRIETTKEKIKSGYAGTLPRVDTGSRRSVTASGTRKALGHTV